MYHCCYGANGPRARWFGSNGSHRRDQKEAVVQKILVVTDNFSWFVQAYKVKDKRAITIAKCLYDNYFRHYGFPQRLLSHQGTELCNAILNEMCIYLNIKKLRTSPYHPQTNGAVEHVHQTLEWMITKLDNKRRRKWPEHLSSITHAYNSTRSQITGYAPYFLMMGCRLRLPIDLLFSTAQTLPGTKGVNEYIKALYGWLREAIELARISADQEAAWHKRLYVLRAGVAELCRGDKVLVWLDTYQGACRKLKNRCGSMLHTVVGRIADDVPHLCDREREGKAKSAPSCVAVVVVISWGGGRTSNDRCTTSIPSLHVGTGASTSWWRKE